MNKKPLLSIVIPCLNEKDTIKRAMLDAQKHAQKYFSNDFEVIVADNGSTDGSQEIVKKHKSVILVNVPVQGYGAALHWGINKSKGKYVLFADADLSYPFSNLKKFRPLIEQNPDLLLGSRLKGNIQPGAMPFMHRYVGTPILTFLINLIYKIPTSDCNSGMRIVKKNFYKKLRMRNSGMEWASELLLKSALNNGKYMEIPIKFVKDKRKRPPHLSTWSDGWRHFKSIFLLKPSSLHPLLLLFPAFAYICYQFSFSLAVFFILLTLVLILVLLTLELMRSALDGGDSWVSKQLKNNAVVPQVAILSLVVALLVIVIPDTYLGTKLVLVSTVAIIYMWLFLIETIKTHLINRLP